MALGPAFKGSYTTAQQARAACVSDGDFSYLIGARGFAGEFKRVNGRTVCEEIDLGKCDGSEFSIGATEDSATDIWVKSGAIAAWDTSGLHLTGSDDRVVLAFMGGRDSLDVIFTFAVLAGVTGSSQVAGDRFGVLLDVASSDAANNAYFWSGMQKQSDLNNRWLSGFTSRYTGAWSATRTTLLVPDPILLLGRSWRYQAIAGNDPNSGLRGAATIPTMTWATNLSSSSQFTGGFFDNEHAGTRYLALAGQREPTSDSDFYFRTIRFVMEGS